ncbi:Minor allergen Cla h [Hortaea werneckii]|nr:Minor allergen Cla h [Hortaea werneckii]
MTVESTVLSMAHPTRCLPDQPTLLLQMDSTLLYPMSSLPGLYSPKYFVAVDCILRENYHNALSANRALERQSTRTFAFVFFSLLRAVGRLLCLATACAACSACSTCRLRCARVTSLDTVDSLVELLAVGDGEVELLLGWLAGAVGGLKEGGISYLALETATTTDLTHVSEDAEGGLVAQRHVDDAVVGEGGHGSNDGALLATTLGGGGDEHTGVPWTTLGTVLPLATSLVPESLPLSREVTVTGRDTEEEGIVLLESGWVLEGRDAAVLWRGVHLGQDLLWERLRDLVEVAGTAGGLDTLGLLLGDGLDVTPGGVLDANVSGPTIQSDRPSLVPFGWLMGDLRRRWRSLEPW